MTEKTHPQHKPQEPGTYQVKRTGVIFPEEFKNRCCPDKPFLLMAVSHEGHHGYSCECECGLWCTTAHKTPAQAIMEYEHMCRSYPDAIEFKDPGLIRKYLAYYEN